MEDNRESGDALFDFCKNVETQRRRHENTVGIACTLRRCEFESTM